MRSGIKSTKITIYEDKATGIASSYNGANLNGMAFNLGFIAEKDPELAQLLMDYYERARELERGRL